MHSLAPTVAFAALTLAGGCGFDECPEGSRSIDQGQGGRHSPFQPAEEGEPRVLVVGNQGRPMFDDLALRVGGLGNFTDGPGTFPGFIEARIGGEPVARSTGFAFTRGGPEGTTELVDLRVIAWGAAEAIWGHEVEMVAEVTGPCATVRSSRAFPALRPGERP